MTARTSQSAKAKGRRLAQKLKEKLHEKFEDIQDGDIQVTPSGLNGPDLYLSPKAKAVIPFQFECKNQEKLNIWAALKQTKSHGPNSALVFSRNHEAIYVTLELSPFLDLIRTRGES